MKWFFIGYWILRKGRFLSAFAFFRSIKTMPGLRSKRKLLCIADFLPISFIFIRYIKKDNYKPDLMKPLARVIYTLLFSVVFLHGVSQNWKLDKNKDGIKVYLAENPKSKFKSIKVECTLSGTYDKLIAILTDIDHLKDWVYNTKTSYLIKKLSPYDLYYYTETSIPWPMENRDAVVHLRIARDSLQRFVKVTSVNENRFVPEKEGKMRVVHSMINWYVTMPTPKTISIVYTFEADPGGNLPAWLVNSFADKGPYESFRKLADLLKK